MQYRVDDFVLDSASRLVAGPQGPLAAPRRVFDCLICLIEHRDRAVARDELILYVWNRSNVSDTQLAQTVLRARRLLQDDGNGQRLIRTVPGFGYHWVGPVTEIQGESAVAAAADDGARPADATDAVHEVAAAEPITGHIEEAARVVIAETPLRSVPPAAFARAANRRPRARRWPWLAIGAVALVVAIAGVEFGAAYLPTRAAAAVDASRRIVVLPVEMDAAAADEAAWARLGLMDLLATRLRAEGAVVPPSESVLAALAALAPRSGSDLRPQALQADLLLQPRLSRLASGWEFSLEGRRASGVDLVLREQHPQVLPAVAAAGDALLRQLGRAPRTVADDGDEVVVRLRAALLGNELGTIRDWLSTLPRAQRQDREMRYLAAEVDYRAGRLAESRAALDALLADDAFAPDAVFRGRVLAARGSIAMRQRDDVAAERDFAAAIATLGHHEGRDLGRAYMGRGGVALRQLRFDVAQADLTRARSLLDAAGDDLGVARAEVNLALLDRRRGHPLEALERLQSAAARFGNYAAVNELSATLVSIVDLQCGLLRWNDALATSDSTQRLLSQLPDPQLRRRVALARTDALLGLGRLDEAAEVLDTIDAGAGADRAYRDVLSAELALARGDRDASLRFAQAVLPDSAGNREYRSRAARLLFANGVPLPPLDIGSTAVPDDDVDLLLLRGLARASREPAAAQADLRAALDGVTRTRDLREQRDLLRALKRVARADAPGDDLLTLAAPLAAAVPRDFDTALLFAELHRERRDIDSWRAALRSAAALAGERRLPDALAVAFLDDETPPRVVRAATR